MLLFMFILILLLLLLQLNNEEVTLLHVLLTSEKDVLPVASATSTRSPTSTSEMNLDLPDSKRTLSDPAKQAFDALEAVDEAACDKTGAI
jgi:hypothetical protein